MRKRTRSRPELNLDRMFDTRSEAWERAGLTFEVDERLVRRARRELGVLAPLLIAILVVYLDRAALLGIAPHHVPPHNHHRGYQAASPWETPVTIAAVLALVAIGWAMAGDIGRVAGPRFMRRMDPATAGTVGFLIRLVTIAVTLVAALWVAGVDPQTLAVGGAFTAVILGLAAQQTIGNVFAGIVLLSARPFRVGERVRFQAGAVGGQVEGVVSSLGLLYTVLSRGADKIMIPNNVVLAAAVVPLREPEKVDVRVRLSAGVRPGQVQAILDREIAVPLRSSASVLLEEVDGDDIVVRIQATPELPDDGAKLADQIIAVLSSVTGRHDAVDGQPRPG
jgi:small-conductance mechanosensitive channel